jgi:hypothetical protein
MKRFCVNGHDTEVVGRNPKGMCRVCFRAAQRRYKARQPGAHIHIRDRGREWDSWKAAQPSEAPSQ